MFKIGDFARLNHVSVKTLRYYDEIGLLKPVRTDSLTGYRYYSAKQLPRLHRIMALKDMEFPLSDIAALVDGRLSAEEAEAMVRRKADEIARDLRTKQAALGRIEAWLAASESKERSIKMNHAQDSFKQVVLKEVNAVEVAGIRTTLQDYAEQQPLWEELVSYLNEQHIHIQSPIAIYYGADANQEDGVEMEVAVPVNEGLAEAGLVRRHLLEPVREMACLIHEGSSERLTETYAALQQWMELNGYGIAGPVREVHIEGYLTNSNPDTHITEIQIPVTKEAVYS